MALWIAVTLAALRWLPDASTRSGDLDGFVSKSAPAVQTEISSLREFGFPLIARTAIVQHDEQGLSVYSQAQAVLRALALTQQSYRDQAPILGALPVVNSLGLFPGTRQSGTTALTYLFMDPSASFAQQTAAAHRFAAEHVSSPDDALVGVTGSIPARVEQQRIVSRSLPTVELATLAAILLIVGLSFRSVVAPVMALSVAAVAFLLTLRLAALAGALLGVSIPAELKPLVLALLLGVVTDYAIFFLAGAQHAQRAGAGRLPAARTAAAEFGPIVAVAGVTVACGTGSLLAARSGFFRAFGPGLALTVLVGVVVAVTLLPALIAILGRVCFWPGRQRPEATAGEVRAAPLREAQEAVGPLRIRLVTWMTRTGPALSLATVCVAGLAALTVPVGHLRLGLSFVPSLPPGNEARVAAAAARAGFADGILSPTVVLVRLPRIADALPALRQVTTELEAQPGVAAVMGPGSVLPQVETRLFVSPSGNAARFFVVLDSQPLGADAISAERRLESRLPVLLSRAGLSGSTTGVAGDTALAAGLVSSTRADLGKIAVTALLVNLVLLVLFLRALVAPLFLLASSVLALGASLGLTVLVFQGLLHHEGLTFYVPFAAAVLLVALGSDYNIFGVGHIWDVARERPLREAIRIAVPRTSRAITAAGTTLAASFALVAVVPLRPFYELGFVMGAGILLDAIIVRSVLVPAVLTLLGPFGRWPSRPPQRTVATPVVAPEIARSTTS